MNLWHASYELRLTVSLLTAATKLRSEAGLGMGRVDSDSGG
jgi:hypothetical protein